MANQRRKQQMNIELEMHKIGNKLNVTMINAPFCWLIDEDDIEDMETNLTNIIKQLQDYRLAQIHGSEL